MASDHSLALMEILTAAASFPRLVNVEVRSAAFGSKSLEVDGNLLLAPLLSGLFEILWRAHRFVFCFCPSDPDLNRPTLQVRSLLVFSTILADHCVTARAGHPATDATLPQVLWNVCHVSLDCKATPVKLTSSPKQRPHLVRGASHRSYSSIEHIHWQCSRGRRTLFRNSSHPSGGSDSSAEFRQRAASCRLQEGRRSDRRGRKS